MSASPLALADVCAAHIAQADVRFTDGNFLYRTTGEVVGAGGMGRAWKLHRWPVAAPNSPTQIVVGKTYRDEYLIFVREDETARRRHDHFQRVLERIRALQLPNVLPVLLMSRIADNFLLVSPLAGVSLLEKVTLGGLTPRERVSLLRDALVGLGALHRLGIVHRDFTLNNVLTLGQSSTVFDFDLAVAPELLDESERTYGGYYRGQIAGAPDFSIAPELLDPVLAGEPISPRIDVYAIGTALHALFTDESLYGDVPDLATLYDRISKGMVHRRESRVRYPDDVPAELRAIIDGCLEREPPARHADAGEVARLLTDADAWMFGDTETRQRVRKAPTFDFTLVNRDRIYEVFRTRLDPSVTIEDLTRLERVLARHGYLLEKSLGRVKGHAIALALPDPELVATARFPEQNTYRKIVTAIDVAARPDGSQIVETWLARIYPILHRVRQGYLTSLHKVAHEKDAGLLLLFSEYVDDPRFGADLARHDLSLEEAFGLALLVALSIARLHEAGLAHNNVGPSSLVFKGRRVDGRVQPLFLGLVEPAFDRAAIDEDVRRLSAIILSWIRPARIDALPLDVREVVTAARKRLERTASGELRNPAPTIRELIEVIEESLAAIEPNFDVLRSGSGDLAAFADVLVRHSLYHRLYALDVSDL